MARNVVSNFDYYCPDCLNLLKKFKDDGKVVYECVTCQVEVEQFKALDLIERHERKQADKRLKASFEKFNKQIN
jgi:DNA-directed RNA polymerase subunit M/transcription elongation factor TFIIS